MVYSLFDNKTSGSGVKQNEKLAKQFKPIKPIKPIIKIF